MVYGPSERAWRSKVATAHAEAEEGNDAVAATRLG